MLKHEDLTLEEKVDILYDTMLKEKRKQWYRLYWKVSLFILFFILPYYLFLTYLPLLMWGWLKGITSSGNPITNSIAQSVTQSVTWPIGDFIKNLPDSDKEKLIQAISSLKTSSWANTSWGKTY